MHTQSKFYSILVKGGLFLLMFSMASCVFYYKKVVKPEAPNEWESMIKPKGRSWNISEYVRVVNGDTHFDLHDMSYEGGILRGELRKAYSWDVPEKNSFRRKKVPVEQRGYLTKTLYVFTDQSLSPGQVELKVEDFQKFQRYKTDVGFSILATTGVVLPIAAGAVVLACLNCPKAYVVDEAGEKHFQGAMFTGAITKSRERIDLLPIETFVTEQDKVSVHIANEFAEVEHLNQLELLKLRRQKGYEVGFGIDADLFEYRSLISPIEAESVDGRDFLPNLLASDESVYDFDDARQGEELNTITLNFQKSAFQKEEVKLLIQTRQTDWMSKTVGGFFSLYGDQYEKVIKRMDKVPARFFDKYNAKQGIAMNAYLKTNQGWQQVGSIQNVGIFKQKLMGIDLDLSEIASDEIEIKLESAFKFWEIDQVALTEDFKKLEAFESVPMLSAINDQGEDVAPLLQKIDKEYAIQNGPGTYIDLTFTHTARADEMYVLKGSGYYYEMREYAHEKQKDALKALRSKKELGADELSRVLYEEFSTLQAARP